MAEAAARSVCDMLEDAVEFIAQEITEKERRIEVLRKRIEKLQGAAEPDTAQIEELSADAQELERQLESDRPQLVAFTEEFQASCGPR